MCKSTETLREQTLDELRWRKFDVLDDGFVCLVDVMGDDASVVQAARVSYGDGTKKVSDDRGLIRYLMRHRHTTPFEMCELKFLVRVPMDAWRQWIRHRTANVNEYSTRYSHAIDSQQRTPPGEWRAQSIKNKQGSAEDGVIDWPEGMTPVLNANTGRTEITGDNLPYMMPVQLASKEATPGEYLSAVEDRLHKVSRAAYETRLALGVAREQARKDLPLSTYTEAYWKIDLHNLLHFLGLRMDSHAQKEIRDFATVMGEKIVKPLFPMVWEAFEDYRLNGMFMTSLDLEALANYMASSDAGLDHAVKFIENERERVEARAKLERIVSKTAEMVF